jgi:hypothetical protein
VISSGTSTAVTSKETCRNTTLRHCASSGGGDFAKPNDRIWVKAPGYGFVGVGRVKGPAEPATDFKIMIDGKEQLAVEGLSGAEYHRRCMTDPDKMEYFVPVEWAQTEPLASAVDEIGLFGIKILLVLRKRRSGLTLSSV